MSTKTARLDWREGRRRRAWELKQQGWKQQDIAAALGVTPGAVSQWLTRARQQDVEALLGAAERLRHKRTVIQACIRQAGYRV